MAAAEDKPDLELDLCAMLIKVSDLISESQDRFEPRDLLREVICPGFRLAHRASRLDMVKCLRNLLTRSMECGRINSC